MTACPFCQSPFDYGFDAVRRFTCGTHKVCDDVEQSADCHARELARIKTERDEWRAVAESRLGECACIGEYKCGRCQSLTAYNNLKNPTK